MAGMGMVAGGTQRGTLGGGYIVAGRREGGNWTNGQDFGGLPIDNSMIIRIIIYMNNQLEQAKNEVAQKFIGKNYGELTASQKISVSALILIAAGHSPIDALKFVVGAKKVDSMIEGLHTDLRAVANA